VAERLDCVSYLDHLSALADGPTWAQRQLDVLREVGEPAEMVRRLTGDCRVGRRRE
jgi:hypothetical protein